MGVLACMFANVSRHLSVCVCVCLGYLGSWCTMQGILLNERCLLEQLLNGIQGISVWHYIHHSLVHIPVLSKIEITIYNDVTASEWDGY